jgi:hypothetical protein
VNQQRACQNEQQAWIRGYIPTGFDCCNDELNELQRIRQHDIMQASYTQTYRHASTQETRNSCSTSIPNAHACRKFSSSSTNNTNRRRRISHRRLRWRNTAITSGLSSRASSRARSKPHHISLQWGGLKELGQSCYGLPECVCDREVWAQPQGQIIPLILEARIAE